MLDLSGSVFHVLYDSARFFRYAQYYHIGMAVTMLGTGVASIVLSEGSDGDAKVPYFFSAFIASAWHIVSAVVCQVAINYLSGDGSQASKASMWIHVYSILCSVFVLFNVMGIVFTVVNGMCIESQLCYYDRNHVANRTMAILLIFEHCVSTLASVILAKRSHLIESELSADTSIKLNTHFNFNLVSRKKSSVCSRSEQTTPENQKESGLSQVQNKDGHVLTTIEISAMSHRKTHRRSKSQPVNLKQLSLQPTEIEGQVFSIYSDSETKHTEKSRKKKKRFISKDKTNRIKASVELSTDKKIRSKSVGDDLDFSFSGDESFSSYGTRLSAEERKHLLIHSDKSRKSTTPLPFDDTESDDLFYVKPADETENVEHEQQMIDEEFQRKQEEMQEIQSKHEKQRKLFQVQQTQESDV